jgi:hypothetical protein
MNDTPYYKYVKLTTGDCLVCKTDEEYNNVHELKTIKLIDPVVLTPFRLPKEEVLIESYIMYPWFSFSETSEYTISTQQVVFCVGIKEKLKENYLAFLDQRKEHDVAALEAETNNEEVSEITEQMINEFLNEIGDVLNEEETTDGRDDFASRARRGTTRIIH